MNDLIANSNSILNQIFIIVMGGLYGISWLIGFTYKTVNIYMYFILFPSSLFLFKKFKFNFIPILLSPLFFAIPEIELTSNIFFDQCVIFLNTTADKFDSNYIYMSVYLCVFVPILIYLGAIFFRYRQRGFLTSILLLLIVSVLYGAIIYPNLKPLLISLL